MLLDMRATNGMRSGSNQRNPVQLDEKSKNKEHAQERLMAGDERTCKHIVQKGLKGHQLLGCD